VTFSVSDAPEVVSVVVATNGVWAVERRGPVRDAHEAVERAYAWCGRDAQCVLPAAIAACVWDKLATWHAPHLRTLNAEYVLFLDALAAVPYPPPDPEAAELAEAEDVDKIHATHAHAARPLEPVLGACAVDRVCVETTTVAAAVAVTNAVAAAQQGTRRRGQERRNATCAAHVATSPAVSTTAWKYDPRFASAVWSSMPPLPGPLEPERRVRHLFKPEAIPAALIALVDNFVSDAECDVIVAAARPRLTRATHAHEGDLSHVSAARDSQQATVRPAHRNQRDLNDPIARVKARTVALANFLSNYSLQLDGQEDLMAVQYNPGQQYMLHCDGSCDGSPFVSGGRIATVLMYCVVADGGGTSFPNAGVHVTPSRGQAVYFHFRGPDRESNMEDWHTEHSGCPVKDGEKWVVTQWLRDGVNVNHPHSRFDPSGGPIGQAN